LVPTAVTWVTGGVVTFSLTSFLSICTPSRYVTWYVNVFTPLTPAVRTADFPLSRLASSTVVDSNGRASVSVTVLVSTTGVVTAAAAVGSSGAADRVDLGVAQPVNPTRRRAAAATARTGLDMAFLPER
jgi:hypothetical protein